MEIKILGSGFLKWQTTEKNIKEALAESGLDDQVDKVTNVMEIAKEKREDKCHKIVVH